MADLEDLKKAGVSLDSFQHIKLARGVVGKATTALVAVLAVMGIIAAAFLRTGCCS